MTRLMLLTPANLNTTQHKKFTFLDFSWIYEIEVLKTEPVRLEQSNNKAVDSFNAG